ncbi:MAG: hypothetical protein ACR2PH_04375 [Desulfobulbia bacterium]
MKNKIVKSTSTSAVHPTWDYFRERDELEMEIEALIAEKLRAQLVNETMRWRRPRKYTITKLQNDIKKELWNEN